MQTPNNSSQYPSAKTTSAPIEPGEKIPSMDMPDTFPSELKTIGELSDEIRLWRYMRLSTLLTLLNGTVFIPTINTLRKTDPTEATRICLKTQKRFETLEDDDKAMLQKFATSDERTLFDAQIEDWQMRHLYFGIWKREFGKRRCVWCWHNADSESKAMWDIYAKAGVAVCTTPARMRRALKSFTVDSGIIGEVRYSDTPEAETSPELFLRPYLFKQSSYRHEREVRVIFPSEPHESYDGHKLQIDGSELIEEVRLSPDLPRDEAIELTNVLLRLSMPLPKYDFEWKFSVGPSEVHQVKEPFDSRYNSPFARSRGIANFGFHKMPFLLSDDIRRELAPRPEWTANNSMAPENS